MIGDEGVGDRADQEDVAPGFEGVLRRREVKSHVNNVIVRRVADPGRYERSIRTGQIGSFLFPTPHPFTGEPRPSYQHSNSQEKEDGM